MGIVDNSRRCIFFFSFDIIINAGYRYIRLNKKLN